jgi:hypothetical protein
MLLRFAAGGNFAGGKVAIHSSSGFATHTLLVMASQ